MHNGSTFQSWPEGRLLQGELQRWSLPSVRINFISQLCHAQNICFLLKRGATDLKDTPPRCPTKEPLGGETFAIACLQWSRDNSLDISSQIDKHTNQQIFSPPNNFYFLTFEACLIEIIWGTVLHESFPFHDKWVFQWIQQEQICTHLTVFKYLQEPQPELLAISY